MLKRSDIVSAKAAVGVINDSEKDATNDKTPKDSDEHDGDLLAPSAICFSVSSVKQLPGDFPISCFFATVHDFLTRYIFCELVYNYNIEIL